MHRLVVATAVLGLFALSACGVEEDKTHQRPRTLEYVTTAVLQPSCGNAQCHSSFRKASLYAFDTVEAARASISDNQLVSPTEPDASLLYLVLISPGSDSDTDEFASRMPYDQPLANGDVKLIYNWILDGANGL